MHTKYTMYLVQFYYIIILVALWGGVEIGEE